MRKDSPSSSNIVPPSYSQYNIKQREEFLSQFGITAPTQRKLFHFLCDHWESLLYFDQFIASLSNSQFNSPRSELESLMSRLREVKLGCLVYRKDDKGDRIPHQIMLCEEASARYWYYVLQDILQQNFDNPRSYFITPTIFKTREAVEIPTALIELFPIEQLSKQKIEHVSKTEKIYYLHVLEEKILVTSQALNALLSFASMRLRSFLKNTELVAVISRLLNINLIEINKKIEDKEPSFWQTLTEVLLKNQENLLVDRKFHLDKGVFQAAELLRIYLVNQVKEAHRQKQDQKERETDMKQLELLVLNNKESIMSQEVLDANINQFFKEKYQEELPRFKDDFYKQYFEQYQKTSLPILIKIHGDIIHRDNFYQYFVRRLLSLQRLAQEEFLGRMIQFVRTSNRKEDLTFVDPHMLRDALFDWLSSIDRFIFNVFRNPQLLTEGLVHYGKTQLNISSIGDLKGLMEQFFQPGMMILRPLQEIFEIDAAQLYEKASRKLSIFVQLWRRITGVHDNQAKDFTVFALPKTEKKDFLGQTTVLSKKTKEPEMPSLDNLSPEEKKKRREEWLARKNQTAPSKPAKQEKSTSSLPSNASSYSQKEQDKAWSEFGSRLKKN